MCNNEDIMIQQIINRVVAIMKTACDSDVNISITRLAPVAATQDPLGAFIVNHG